MDYRNIDFVIYRICGLYDNMGCVAIIIGSYLTN